MKPELEYKAIIDSISDKLIVINHTMAVVLANAAVKKWLLDLHFHTDIENKTIYEALPFLPITMRNDFEAIFENGTSIVGEDSVVINKTKIILEIRKEPIFRENRVHQILIIFRDITDRKAAEAELTEAHRNCASKAAELQSINNDLKHFNYIVSHDLKAPLRAINTYAYFLRRDLNLTEDTPVVNYLKGLEHSIHHAKSLIDDLLELSRLDQISFHFQMVDLGNFIRSLLQSFKLSSEIQIIMPDEWPMIQLEPVLMRQLFQNLIENAIKFNVRNPKIIELKWSQIDDNHFEVQVHDNGIGIEQRYLDKIFGVFERINTSEQYEGTGIGLAIVKKAVAKLGGTIRVESEVGVGSTFYVTLKKSLYQVIRSQSSES